MSKFYKDGFYLQQSEHNDRIEITDEYWGELMSEQSKGRVILPNEEGYPVAVDYTPSESELLNKEMCVLLEWFDGYDNQIKQYERCIRTGIEFDKDIQELDRQAQINSARITEIRKLLK